jgi:hypothetical protein
MAWAHMDNQPLTAYAKPERWTVVSTGPQEDKPTRPTTIGKVLGTLYTEWEAREQMADPVYEVCNAVIERNLRVFFAEYTSRLSQTVRMQLADLAAYIRRESNGNVLAVDEAVQALTSAKGKKDPGTSKLAKFVDNLHYRFDHKESVSCPEFIGLLYRYSDICGDTE